jgi:hypothetical protein
MGNDDRPAAPPRKVEPRRSAVRRVGNGFAFEAPGLYVWEESPTEAATWGRDLASQVEAAMRRKDPRKPR